MPIAIRIENVSKLYRLDTVGTGTLSHDHRYPARDLCTNRQSLRAATDVADYALRGSFALSTETSTPE